MTSVVEPEGRAANSLEHWNIASIVSELRALRASAPGRSPNERPCKLPSQKSLVNILDGLTTALFPNRLGVPGHTDEGIDFFVGNTLATTLKELNEQVRRELQFLAGLTGELDDIRRKSFEITSAFAAGLPDIRRLLESDIRAAYRGDPAARSVDEVLICYPGVTAITHHRLAHRLFRLGAPLVARIIAEIAHSTTGIDIHPGAQIKGHFFIDHGTGVVIGESAEIGERVRLYQAVTLGAKRFETEEDGALVKGTPRHPIVEDDVVIYAGATILGRITIGRGSIIGGNVWVTRSVPPGSHISQAKTRMEVYDAGDGI